MKGATTLEAAIIIPIVLITVMVLIYMMLYLHDEATLYSLADEYLQTYTVLEDTTGSQGIYESPIKVTQDSLSSTDLFLLTDSSDIQIDVNMINHWFYIEANIEISMPIDFFVYSGTLMVKRKRIITSGSEIVRVIECVGDISSDFMPFNNAKVTYNQAMESLLTTIK
ncbi:MAG: pilus assembly protein [Vallitaleaceae bacterium]|jgi:hypothetical protein|nr:pilus assembly protein [Vallitaleaceae bacterium]